VVFGQVIGPEPAAVIGFDQAQAISELPVERHAGVVHVVEDSEFHGQPPALFLASNADANRRRMNIMGFVPMQRRI
jgi:hypothetical protein